MITPPCSVISAQSPWRQTFGNRSKYAARYFDAVGIVPERHRHARKRRRAHELPCCPTTELPVVVEDFDLHPEAARLELAAPHRADRIAEREARDDVRSAADAAQPNVGFTSLVHVVVAMLGQRASGREDRLQPREDRASRSGCSPSFSASASHFALVPNTVTRSSAAMSQRIGRRRMNGAPS